jgi:hypothetical protein
MQVEKASLNKQQRLVASLLILMMKEVFSDKNINVAIMALTVMFVS